MSSRDLHALLQRVQAGSAPAEQLRHALEAAAGRITNTILPAPRNAIELQNLRDPNFEHCGHKLEELGRTLVEKLADELNISELLCWELLLRENEAATSEGVLAPSELVLGAKQSYHDEREHVLLLLLDCFKLSLLDPSTQIPAQPAAVAFLARLERGDAEGLTSPSEGLSMQLLRAVSTATASGLPSDPHRRKELMQAPLRHPRALLPRTVPVGRAM